MSNSSSVVHLSILARSVSCCDSFSDKITSDLFVHFKRLYVVQCVVVCVAFVCACAYSLKMHLHNFESSGMALVCSLPIKKFVIIVTTCR